MNNANDKWKRLVEAARHAPAGPPREMPFGFATRVAARWASGERIAAASWEKLALRALAFAALLMAVSVTVNFDLFADDWRQELAPNDPVFGNLLEP